MSDETWLWFVIVVWSAGFLAMIIAAPASGFFTRLSLFRSAILVLSLGCIFVEVYLGRSVPNDLDSITMLIHFVNISQQFVVHPTYGPLIIMVERMSVDIIFWLAAFGFCIVAFYFVLGALYAGQTPEFAGETYGMGHWPGAVTMLVNYVGGPQLLWTVPESAITTAPATILSQVFGTSDAFACDVVGFCVMMFAWLLCPLLLVNLLIAMMASSYTRVEKDSDLEWKWFRASAVIVAREMSAMPVPFNLCEDALRLIRKLMKSQRELHTRAAPLHDGVGEVQPMAKSLSDSERSVAHSAVEQIVLQWETRKSLELLRSSATMDQMERMRTQVEAVTERVNMVYTATQLGSTKLDALRLKRRDEHIADASGVIEGRNRSDTNEVKV
jgi:hypothetical protein